MIKKIFLLLNILLFLLFSVNVSLKAENEELVQENKNEKGEEFDLNEMIMHHIKDAHEWQILEYHNSKGVETSVIVPLPIILIANGQFDIFLSNQFEHGNKIVEKGNNKYILHHEKIYLANEAGELDVEKTENGEGKILNEKPWDFSITKNVASMLLVSVIVLLIFITVAKSYKKHPGRPKGIQAFLEPVILFVRDDIIYPCLGERTSKFLPYLLTVFFFIIFNNLMGIIPFFPGNANATGNIAVTLTLALFTFIAINVFGNKHYWKHTFWMPGVPVFVKPILAIVELIGIIVKPVALTIRLFANITAGHIIILSLVGLIFLFKFAMAPVSFIFVLFMDCLELLVAFLQAYIFTMLSALFIGISTEPHHH
ncbi:MAG: F0F1 ATP synthase subunit A [Bacteroidales bacterium]|jgi:F-type H+-transporting ATPase subunit a|nr:F0F1 ATP synthase subunit A [Bacteroidales bacterium]